MEYKSRLLEYCKEYQKIENYELAKADNFKEWHCHHRLELTLDNEYAHSREELIRLNMYYNRPYFELIFLTSKEHNRLHNLTNKARYVKVKATMTGRPRGTFDNKWKQNLSNSHKGLKWRLVNGKRVWFREEAV